MKKKNKNRLVFPANRKTEFARFTDPNDFTFDPDVPGADLRDDTFFGMPPVETGPKNDERP